MRRVLPLLLLLVLPSALWAQSVVRVSSVAGQAEWRAASSTNFVALKSGSQQILQVGDELKTGPDGAQIILETPDGSYMVISENTKLVIDDFWSSNFRSLINLMIGKVRFFIQKQGGRPSPYRVTTPTALIAVRGTIFEVTVDQAQIAEVWCFEGQVAVESVGLSDREVILNPGRKTLVRPGEYPLTPVNNSQPTAKNRVIPVVKKTVPDVNSPAMPSVDVLARDNDRRNRTSDPRQAPGSRTNENTQRAKPTLKFPN